MTTADERYDELSVIGQNKIYDYAKHRKFHPDRGIARIGYDWAIENRRVTILLARLAGFAVNAATGTASAEALGIKDWRRARTIAAVGEPPRIQAPNSDSSRPDEPSF